MSDTNKLLDQILAEPTSLNEQRTGEDYLINEQRGDSLPNSSNLTTMMLLRSLYKDSTIDSKDAIMKSIDGAVNEESKYLVEAMSILSGDLPTDPKVSAVFRNLRDKYGKTIEGASILANLIRRKTNEREFNIMIDPIVKKVIESRKEGRPYLS